MNSPTIIVITGPTASGKSELALNVAQRLGAPIISADSRQIYRGIPITTALPSLEERQRVTHYLIDFLDLDKYYSAAAFADDARRIIQSVDSPYVVVCGGSMLYVDTLLYGIDDLPAISPDVRQRVLAMHRHLGLEGIMAYLENLDPVYAATVDPRNTRRVMHAVELCLQADRPVSDILAEKKTKNLPQPYYKFVIGHERPRLFDRINRRVRRMVEMGMEQEARSVYHLRHLNALNTIGFKEWFAHFDGKMDRPTAIDRIAKNTRVYAKKQLTWLQRHSDVTYLNPDTAIENILRKTLD